MCVCVGGGGVLKRKRERKREREREREGGREGDEKSDHCNFCTACFPY